MSYTIKTQRLATGEYRALIVAPDNRVLMGLGPFDTAEDANAAAREQIEQAAPALVRAKGRGR